MDNLGPSKAQWNVSAIWAVLSLESLAPGLQDIFVEW